MMIITKLITLSINILEENLHMKLDVILSENYYNDCIGPRGFMALRGNKELKELLKIN
jgi:hypothetical protein